MPAVASVRRADKPRRSRRARIGLAVLNTIAPNTIVWDTEIKGFGVRLQQNVPSYFLKTRSRGRQVWLTIGKHGSPWTPDLARTEALRLLLEARSGRDIPQPSAAGRPASGAMTVSAAIARFNAEHVPKLKPRTQQHYEWTLARLIEPKLGRKALDGLGPTEVGRFHVGLADTPGQANGALTVLSSFITWCMDMKLLPRGENPCGSIRRFKEKKRERYLSVTELQRLAAVLDTAEADATHSVHALAAIRLLILTGARLNEILTLKWEYVSFDQARLSLPDSKTGFKFIGLNDHAVAVLRALPRIDGNPHVIAGHRRGAHMVNLQGIWSDVRTAAKLTDVRLHDLRHSFASFAVDAGASLPLVGKLLGHASVATTARYAHLSDKRAQDMNQVVGNVIGGVLKRKDGK